MSYIFFGMVLLILIISYYFTKSKSISTSEITGRNYSSCLITNNFLEIERIRYKMGWKRESIPQIIHQIWLGPRAIPWKWINSFRLDFMEKYPGWKYYLWTEKEVAKLKLKNRRAYESDRKFCGKADILRYELLYQYGGIYIDADSHWLGLDLGELIEKTNNTGIFIGNECQDCKGSLANGVLGCSVKNPIMKYLITQLNRHYFKCRGVPAYKRTGPYFVDQILYPFDITIFPYHYFYPVYWNGKKSLKISIDEQKKRFPHSYMTQYGYTTNRLN